MPSSFPVPVSKDPLQNCELFLFLTSGLSIFWAGNRKIEEKRGVTVNDSGVPEVKPGSAADGIQLQTPIQKIEKVASAAKNSPAWDDDWPFRPKVLLREILHPQTLSLTILQFNHSHRTRQQCQRHALQLI